MDGESVSIQWEGGRVKDEFSPPSFVVGLFTGIVLMLIYIATLNATPERAWQNLAVKAGKAEYYLDENNDKQWRWKQ